MSGSFVRLSDVSPGPWKVAGDSVCADCSHVGERHGAATRGACDVAGCPCGEFALWKGDKPGANVRRFASALRALGPEGDGARLLWSKARPSAVAFVDDLSRKCFAERVGELVELSRRVDPERVSGLAVVVEWSDDSSEAVVCRFRWRALTSAVGDGECAACAPGVSMVPGEAVLGLWTRAPGCQS